MDTQIVEVTTREGLGRLFIDAVPEGTETRATLLLGHGAGGGVTAADLQLLARTLPAGGTSVIRFEQPWRTAGRRVAVPPPRLDVGWRSAVPTVLTHHASGGKLLFGGRSAGARVACRTAAEFDVAGVVCLAFPLHLPGRPEKSRLPELLTPTVPRLVVQGTNDSFGKPAEIRAGLTPGSAVVLVELPGADHSYQLPKASTFTPADLRRTIVASVTEFIDGLSSGNVVVRE